MMMTMISLRARVALMMAAMAFASPLLAAPVTTVEFNATQSGVQPFTLGLGFGKGEVPGVPVLATNNAQVIVKARWRDGSVKHAIASGQIDVVANQTLSVAVNAASSAPAGTALTAADIATANPQASISFGAAGTVNLSSLLATPIRTWLSGPEMVEAHYRGVPGTSTTLAAWFHVRLYKNGRVQVRVIAENGRLDIGNADASYVPTVSIGGTVVYNNNGASLAHPAHTRWSREAWIGAEVSLRAQQDTRYLARAKLVPNYMEVTASASALDGLPQTYTPLQRGGWTQFMGDTGYQDQIGLLPRWDALYITSRGDVRAWRAVRANALALGTYPLVWKDSQTRDTPKPSARATWTVNGAGGGGETQIGTGNVSWDIAHHGSGGYLAYLITGDYIDLETMADQSALCFLLNTSSAGSGTQRLMVGQTRGAAWCLRTIGQYTGIAPDDDAIAADYRALLANNMSHWKSVIDGLNNTGIGYFYEYSIDTYGPGLIAPWQQHFMMQALGMGSDLEPLSDMTAFLRVRDWVYRGAVGILGDGNGYCFTRASAYNAKIAVGGNNDPASWYPTWAQVFSATHGTQTCGNTLLGDSGGAPSVASQGYWGNLMPAIAYAVDHQAPGAATAWARLTGATNWPTVLGSGFESVPNFGVTPRAQVNADVLFAHGFESP